MNLSQEEIDKINKEELERSEKEYTEFVSAFKQGKCSYCGENLDYFNKYKPCVHWLLISKGMKKNDFNSFLKNSECFRLMAYLRWVANQEKPFDNINDLKIESRDSRIFETTIKFQNKEYTFCCTKSDFEGHGRFNFPHYHICIKIDGNRFINFHDFHLKLSKQDLFELDCRLGKNDKIKYHWGRGAGMQDIMDLDKKFLIDNLKRTEKEEDSSFHLSNWIEAKEGQTLSGDELQDIFDESKITGRTIASLAREKLKDASITTIISPGDGVVELNERYSRGKKK
jgi:hypothetical protein